MATASPEATFISILLIAAILSLDRMTIQVVGSLTLVGLLIIGGSLYYIWAISGLGGILGNFASGIGIAIVVGVAASKFDIFG